MLLIFEDANGNLIQFSKNKIANIPSFFQECRYNNIVEFCAKDYPNFFKVNHYKKHKERAGDDYDEDDLDFEGEDSPSDLPISQSVPSNKSYRKDKMPGQSRVKEEDYDSNNMIYQSASEESADEDNMDAFPQVQPQVQIQPQHVPKENPQVGFQKKNNIKPKSRSQKTEEPRIQETQEINLANEQEINVNQKESFQAYKEAPQRMRGQRTSEIPPQFNNNSTNNNNFEHPFNRNNQPAENANSSFRFYPTDNSNMNIPNSSNPAFINNPNFNNSYPNNPAYQNAPNHFKPKKNVFGGFGNFGMGNMNPMANMNNMPNMNNMGAMGNEEAFAMLKGFNPLGFAIGGANPFMAKANNKPEMDEKLLDTAHMIKYLNGAPSYPSQKMYNNMRSGNEKTDDPEMNGYSRYRNDNEGPYENDNEYNDGNPYARGDYRMENSVPANLPSAYFSSKKFNFDGYFNNFEDDRFNEFGDPKKKVKPTN